MQPKSDSKQALDTSKVWDRSWRELVAKHIASLRFGVVQIVVHDSRVVQIERTEKVRLDREEN
jgi:hypothetical protein